MHNNDFLALLPICMALLADFPADLVAVLHAFGRSTSSSFDFQLPPVCDYQCGCHVPYIPDGPPPVTPNAGDLKSYNQYKAKAIPTGQEGGGVAAPCICRHAFMHAYFNAVGTRSMCA
jgi:hypothetical protein